MTKQICKNCGYNFEGAFCFQCGQRNIANKRLKVCEVLNDFLDNTFNIHKGFFFTIYSLLLRPGKVGTAYIEGQRKVYTNPTRYMVIALAFQTFIDYWFETTAIIKNDTYYTLSFLSDAANKSMEVWNVKLAIEYILLSNLFMIVFIPGLLYVVFKKLNFNYAELLATSFYFIPTILFINMPFLVITKGLFGVFVTKEIIIGIFLGYLYWSFGSFFKMVPIGKRLLMLTLVFSLFMFIRILLLPLLLSLLYPLT